MAITKAQKELNLEELRNLISSSTTIIVWEYLGLTANEQSELRIKIRNADGFNKVFKNRLAKIAFAEAEKAEINDALTGSSSFLFISNDDSTALKELYEIVKKHDNLSFKGGFIDGEFYDGAKILELAGLPSKPDLISMLLSVLQGTIRNLAYSLSQVASKNQEKEENSSSSVKTEIAEAVTEKEVPTNLKDEAEVAKTPAE